MMRYTLGIITAVMALSVGAYATDAVRVDKNGLVTISAAVPNPVRFMFAGGQDGDGNYHALQMDSDGRVLCNSDHDRR